MKEIANYLDSEGKIKIWPSKRDSKFQILKYLASNFSHGNFYTEKEVNQIISEMHTFNDYFLLRRELIDNKLLVRTNDCSKYWKCDVYKHSGKEETERLKIVDATHENAEVLKKIYLSCGYLKDWTGTEHTLEYIDSILSEGDLPPGGHKEFYSIKCVYDKETNVPIALLDYYHGFPKKDVLFVSSLFIDQDYQSKGYGKEIVQCLIDAASQAGYSKVAIGVHLKNWPALRFWTKNGFDKVLGIYGDKIHDLNNFSVIGLEKVLSQ